MLQADARQSTWSGWNRSSTASTCIVAVAVPSAPAVPNSTSSALHDSKASPTGVAHWAA